jgi:hypothetical protein
MADLPESVAVPEHLRGDGPCADCGTLDNIVWFTESVFWNDVVRAHGPDKILCIPCFVLCTDAVGYFPTGWQLLPDWHWETKAERDARRAAAGLLDAPAPTRAVINRDATGLVIGEESADGPPFPTDFGSGQLRRAERKPTRGHLSAPTRSGEEEKTNG